MNLTSKKYLSQVEEVIKKAEAGDVYPVYLFIGDRPIIHPQINKLIDCLVPEEAKDFNFEILSPDFKPVEFDGFKKQAGLNSFTLTSKQWIEQTNAVGLISKRGRYGGTYAHKDIAFEFASWISVEFKLYLIKEFQRLKDDERKQLGWDIRRNLTKIKHRIHTDAIKENLIPPDLSKSQINHIYATEVDILNMVLFGMTAAIWRKANPDKKGNIRDYADVSQLVCLSNLENLNALFVNDGLPYDARLERLNKIAIQQMRILTSGSGMKRLEGKSYK